jgi:hypothetical protein
MVASHGEVVFARSTAGGSAADPPQPRFIARFSTKRVTRRHLQLALGLLWLLDGALQLQSYMFTTGLSADILAPAGDGQPQWVSGPAAFVADRIAEHPAPFNVAFAVVQLCLGVGFLVHRSVRSAIIASVVWSLGVWWLGEGLGGLASGHATLLTGAPGAVALYAVLAAAVWPRNTAAGGREDSGRPVAAWLPAAWALVWVGGAVLQALPGQHRASVIAAQIAGGADGAPGWLAATDRVAADAVKHAGASGVLVLIALLAAIGLAAVLPGRARAAAAAGGTVLALLFWIVGQNLGELYSGQSTDPNTGPLLVLFAVAILTSAPMTAGRRASLSQYSIDTPANGRVGDVCLYRRPWVTAEHQVSHSDGWNRDGGQPRRGCHRWPKSPGVRLGRRRTE